MTPPTGAGARRSTKGSIRIQPFSQRPHGLKAPARHLDSRPGPFKARTTAIDYSGTFTPAPKMGSSVEVVRENGGGTLGGFLELSVCRSCDKWKYLTKGAARAVKYVVRHHVITPGRFQLSRPALLPIA